MLGALAQQDRLICACWVGHAKPCRDLADGRKRTLGYGCVALMLYEVIQYRNTVLFYHKAESLTFPGIYRYSGPHNIRKCHENLFRETVRGEARLVRRVGLRGDRSVRRVAQVVDQRAVGHVGTERRHQEISHRGPSDGRTRPRAAAATSRRKV